VRKAKPEGKVDPGNPYFAHLRTESNGRVQDVFLGKATNLDNGLRIVDWRHAPVAKIFYRYREGDSFEEDLGPRVMEGRVLVRRTVSIHRAELRRVDAPQGIFVRGPDGWAETPRVVPKLATGVGAVRAEASDQRLGAQSGRAIRADKHLPDIAALIDPEQFDLIARPDGGPVVIRGGAGSGKTTVLLHRIAWLANANPKRFAGENILVVVWGKALRDYVGKVLPSLGVEGVQVVTWQSWCRQVVRRHYPSLPSQEEAATPDAVSRFKLHPGLARALEMRVRARRAPATAAEALEDWRLVVSDRALMEELGFPERDVEVIAGWARRQLDELAKKLEERLADARPWLDDEDDAILLRCWQLRVGHLRSLQGAIRYAHVAVDEVQDFSAMEIATLLGLADEKQCVTLAGDTQQHIVASGGSASWNDLLTAIGVEGTSLSSLKVSYRSTRTITAFARALLGDTAEDDAPPLATRDGAPVEVFDFPDHGGCVDFVATALRDLLAAEPLAAVAVITPDAKTSELYFEGLERAEVPLLRQIHDQTFSFSPGVDVVDVDQVKGLEFDYVVLVDVGAHAYPERPRPRRQLHVAATRAIHQLWVTSVGEPSPLVTRALAGATPV
jgi:DNA helicase-2/ATP-dependent DNA helicase PcrA